MLTIGCGCSDITPEEPVPMAGCGDRTHCSAGVHDPLYARAWYLEPAGGEPLVEVAFDWQERFPDRAALVSGLLGAWAGYFPHRGNFEEPRAERLYETVSTLFAPETAEELLGEAERRAWSESSGGPQ